MGTAFQNENMIKKLVILLYKISCKKAGTVFFENEGNEQVFLKNKIIKETQTCLLPGAGIDLNEYTMTSYPEESRNIRFLFIGRVMKEKGVEELFKVATNIKKAYPEASLISSDQWKMIIRNEFSHWSEMGSFIIMAIRKTSNHSLRNVMLLYYRRIMKAWQIHC